MRIKRKKYSTAFTSGSLLFKETDAFIENIKDPKLFIDGNEEVHFSCIPINAEASKKRLAREIAVRLRNLSNKKFIELYLIGDIQDRHLILFYAACKTYQMISDFMIDSVLNKWYNLDYELSTYDFQNFIYKQIDKHSELEELDQTMIKKLSQVAIRMLNELGMLKNNIIQKLEFNASILSVIYLNGDSWFLDVLLLNEKEKKEIVGQ